jgi:hypothetical protein
MDLNPEKNIYVGKLKKVVDAYQDPNLSGGLNEIVDALDLTSDEIMVFAKYFVTPRTLDLSSANEDDEPHLRNLIFKYCRLELETQAVIKRQDRELKRLTQKPI